MGLPAYFNSTTLRTIVVEGGHTDDTPVRESARRAHLELIVGNGREAELAAGMFVELAARTVGSMRIETPLLALTRELQLKARAINPRIAESLGPQNVPISVALGATSVTADLHMWSGGWWCGFEDPGSTPPRAPTVGALACGAIAFDLAFARIFSGLLPDRPEPSTVPGWSLREWTARSPEDQDFATLETAALPHTALVGCGAIGQAICYALGRSELRGGPLDLIDPQLISGTNLQRYIGSQAVDATKRAQKVLLAARLLGDRFTVRRHAGRDWAAYRHETAATRTPELVMTALDSALARRLVQAALPRRIVNGWTRTSDCGAALHVFDGPDQCLSCTYLPRDAAAPLNDFRQLSLELGLEPLRVVQLIAGGSLKSGDVRAVERHRNLPADSLRRWRGESVRSLYGELCGVVNVRTDARQDYIVPLPQASALAGVLVVAQVLKIVSGVSVSTRPVEVSLLPAPGPIWELPPTPKDQSPIHCVCKDPAYLTAYRDAWPSA